MTMPDPAWWERQVTEMQLSECRHGLPARSCADCILEKHRAAGFTGTFAVTPEHLEAWRARDEAEDRYGLDWDALTDVAVYGDPRSKWVTASWDGTCASCGERWEGGEEQIRFDPECGGWVCAACGSEEIA